MPIKRQLGHDPVRLLALGRRLRELRLQAGYGLAEVASILGVARSSYTNWENGRRCPDALALAVLSGLFAVEPGAILQAVPGRAITPGAEDRPAARGNQAVAGGLVEGVRDLARRGRSRRADGAKHGAP
jgi:transcriptional regulator with XRE-family HTH domain